eukprot:2570063-Prorocentrum_lima.AAC.1
MTSSLVGSEMCIRDRANSDLRRHLMRSKRTAEREAVKAWKERDKAAAVSYTHLTLPTICSV